MFSLQSALNQLLIETKIATLVAHVRKVRGMKSQENTSNGSQDTVEEVLRSPRKLLVSYQPHQNVHCLYHERSEFGCKISVMKGAALQ